MNSLNVYSSDSLREKSGTDQRFSQQIGFQAPAWERSRRQASAAVMRNWSPRSSLLLRAKPVRMEKKGIEQPHSMSSK
jgi:hypothetical protein